jgi:hypothetical protein
MEVSQAYAEMIGYGGLEKFEYLLYVGAILNMNNHLEYARLISEKK